MESFQIVALAYIRVYTLASKSVTSPRVFQLKVISCTDSGPTRSRPWYSPGCSDGTVLVSGVCPGVGGEGCIPVPGQRARRAQRAVLTR